MQSFCWIVSLISARQHYAVPRAFHLTGQLHAFYTDAWCRHGSRLLRYGRGRVRALAGRFHPDLPSQKVVSFTLQTLIDEAMSSNVRHARSVETKYLEYIRVGQCFSQAVSRSLQSQPIRPETHA